MSLFAPDEVRALQTLVRIWTMNRFALIGASALRVHLGNLSRETHDIDVVLDVALDQYPEGLDLVPGWSQAPGQDHTWIGPGQVRVDVLPMTAAGGSQGTLTWPGRGFKMTLTGLRLVSPSAVETHLDPELRVRVAPLEVITLLKMVSFLDRPHERDRDLADIALVFDSFVPEDDPHRFDEPVHELGLQFEEVSPYMLGRKLSGLVNREERGAVNNFVHLLKEAGYAQARMIEGGPSSWHKQPEEWLLRLGAFERGLQT